MDAVRQHLLRKDRAYALTVILAPAVCLGARRRPSATLSWLYANLMPGRYDVRSTRQQIASPLKPTYNERTLPLNRG